MTARPPARDPGERFALWIATVGGVGRLPRAPGTFGALAALPIAWGLHSLFGGWGVALAALGAFLAGLWAADIYIRISGIADPGPVVIDELAAQLLVLAIVAPGIMTYAIAFASFRLFDIWKPFPVGWADRRLKGGIGAMTDDLLAALYAGAVTHIANRLLTAM